MKHYLIMGVANKRSIAWGIAQELIKEDATLFFSYHDERSAKQIRELLEGREATLIPCDVTKDEDIRLMAKSLRDQGIKLDGILHSIAHAKKEDLEGRFLDTSRSGFSLAMDISVYSLVKVLQETENLLQNGASVLALTYLGGERVVKNYNVMGVAKAALDSSIRYLARELGDRQIRVNGLSAGPIRTLAARGISGFNDILGVYEERSPLRRNVDMSEVARSAHFLLSSASSGITGEILHVDGGFSIIGY